jgi:hypothetical protein
MDWAKWRGGRTSKSFRVLRGPKALRWNRGDALAFCKTLPRVGVKIPHTLYFMGYVDVPDRGEKIEIPIRVIVRADEMPEQVERYEEGIIFWVEGEQS